MLHDDEIQVEAMDTDEFSLRMTDDENKDDFLYTLGGFFLVGKVLM